MAKAEKDDELVWADPVEDIDEPIVDDIDTNKTAEEAADEWTLLKIESAKNIPPETAATGWITQRKNCPN